MKESTINQLAEIIRTELLKRGIIVSVSGKKGKKGIEFTSSDFQTTPVLFKRISINAWVTERDQEENWGHEALVFVHANYELFEGGSNGIDLFNIKCGISKDGMVYFDSVR